MDAQNFPVTVLVTRPDGSTEDVRVGTATRQGDGFRLTLGELAIGTQPDAPSAAARSGGRPNPGGMVFPPYGRSKGTPVAGASTQDLEFYLGGCRRTLDDPSKSRWHEKERVLMAAIEAELARQRGAGAGAGVNAAGNAGDDGFGATGGFNAPGPFDDPPAHSDDDIPF